ncbi:Crp/Fnr family transcriptional regulator [Sphingobacterium corticibacter]|uniref:Crp/Fnr family transcriptional regulator n=1 Tax=Sphingobacterium corticibacter TaxID=2171749 RepID=A0A2T8HM23_9SPHI|nr:Crp/Fnr family transcriptional regulator [Sphingobacterium corticibacter]PVH26440.1 Crp/Fnr family transcriptional regulator [Sphingobacterium corticibacter]
MNTFIEQVERYQKLSTESSNAFLEICVNQDIKKGAFLQLADEPAKYIYFIVKGLVGYYTTTKNGDVCYKMFFAENSFVASTAAMISHLPSQFAIVALEDCSVIRYPVDGFKQLCNTYHDIALFHMHYLEINWVLKKEPLEIALRHETAKERFLKLSTDLPMYARLKKHHIASYLGITPTQLSRVIKELKS